jgi:subtilisin family serine protease
MKLLLSYPRAATLFAALAVAACGGSDPASEISAGVESLAFRGTSVELLDIQANGSWEAIPSQSWITVEPSSGSGNRRVQVTVDRSGLEVGSHSGSITLQGAVTVSVPILARFPEVSGSVRSSAGHLASQRAEPRPDRFDAPYVPGEILVRLDQQMVALEEHGRLDAEASTQALERAASRMGERVGARASSLIAPPLAIATMKVDGDVRDAIAALEAEGHVLYAEPNYILHPTAANDTYYEWQWHYRVINLEQAWEITTGFEEVIVAVIDGDFHPDHPDLAENLLPGWDFVRDTDDFYTFNEGCGAHGTHVAGTVAAVTNNGFGVAGVAPNVRVIPMNVARRPEDENPEFPPCQLDSAAIVRAILYAAGLLDNAAGRIDRPVDVINMSLGGSVKSEVTADALAFARDVGVVSVAAAGNSSRGAVGFPAALNSTIAVSATDQFDELATYSSIGPEVWVAAPGGQLQQPIEGIEEERPAGVLSTAWLYNPPGGGNPDHGYSFLHGTSMASPHVAGVAALIRSANPNLDPGEVQSILATTAVDLGDPGRDTFFGFGRIDAAAAVAAARDELRVSPDRIVVKLMDGNTVVAEARADVSGEFNLGEVPAGSYQIVAGDERYGRQGVPGTVFGERTLTVSYEGDVTTSLDLTPQ